MERKEISELTENLGFILPIKGVLNYWENGAQIPSHRINFPGRFRLKNLSWCMIFSTMKSLVLVFLLHHSFAAEFDAAKPVELKGIVTRLDWVNPHAWIYIDVKDEKGTVTSWGCELGSPNLLTRNASTP